MNNEDKLRDLKNIVPKPYVVNKWYEGILKNGKKIEGSINSKGFYKFRVPCKFFVRCHENNEILNIIDDYNYFRINKKNEVIKL